MIDWKKKKKSVFCKILNETSWRMDASFHSFFCDMYIFFIFSRTLFETPIWNFYLSNNVVISDRPRFSFLPWWFFFLVSSFSLERRKTTSYFLIKYCLLTGYFCVWKPYPQLSQFCIFMPLGVPGLFRALYFWKKPTGFLSATAHKHSHILHWIPQSTLYQQRTTYDSDLKTNTIIIVSAERLYDFHAMVTLDFHFPYSQSATCSCITPVFQQPLF